MKAIGIQPTPVGGVSCMYLCSRSVFCIFLNTILVITKTENGKNGNKPAKLFNYVSYRKNKSNRKLVSR